LKSLVSSLTLSAIIVGVTACGGGDPVSKADFVTQANQICADSNEAVIAAAGESLSAKPTRQEITNFWNVTGRPEVEKRIDQIAELDVPEGEEAEIEAILTALESGTEETQAQVDAGKAIEGDDPYAEASRLAEDYGLTDCAG
jgi:hypothetical protein